MPSFAGIVPYKEAQHHRKESESGYMGESHAFLTTIVAVDLEKIKQKSVFWKEATDP